MGRFNDPLVSEETKAKEKKAPKEFSFGEMASNIPGSAMQLGMDMATPFIHPIDTMKGIGQLGAGLVEKGVNYFAPGTFNEQSQGLQSVNAVGDYLGKRYGGKEELLNTLQEDPVGLFADVAGLATGGTSLAARLPGKVGKVARVASRASTALDPINATAGVVKAAAKTVPIRQPAKMLEKAVKFGTAKPRATRNEMIQTMLREDIMPTQKGLDKLDTLLENSGGELDDIIESATARGERMNLHEPLNEVKAVQKELGDVTNFDRLKDMAESRKLMQDYLRTLGSTTDLTPSQMNALKRDLYQTINFNRQSGQATRAGEVTRKAMARGARRALEDVDPRIAEINRKLGDLLELRENLPQPTSRIENQNILGLGHIAPVTAGTIIGGPAGTMAGVAAAAAMKDLPMSWLALKLEKLRKGKPRLSDLTGKERNLLIRQALLQSGRLEGLGQ